MANEDFEVFLTDPGKSMYFSFASTSFKGDRLKSERNHGKVFTMDLEEIHWLQGNGECTLYGEQEAFKTYADCISYHEDVTFRPMLGCSVPWLAGPDQAQSLCVGRVNLTEEMFKKTSMIFGRFLEGLAYRMFENSKYCLKPCTEVHVTSTNIQTTKSSEGQQTIGFYFNANAKVTEEMMAYGLFDLLVEIGSSLGLWIGLSALGIFDLALAAGAKGKKFI